MRRWNRRKRWFEEVEKAFFFTAKRCIVTINTLLESFVLPLPFLHSSLHPSCTTPFLTSFSLEKVWKKT